MKSRALKEEAMPMMKETTMNEMMKEGKDMIVNGKNSMMRGRVMMMGSQMLSGIAGKNKQKNKKPDLSEFDETYHWSKAKKGKK